MVEILHGIVGKKNTNRRHDYFVVIVVIVEVIAAETIERENEMSEETSFIAREAKRIDALSQ
jgi:hypothetical protein